MSTIDSRNNLHSDDTGRFEDKVGARPGGTLLTDAAPHLDRDWGSVNVREGSRSPWGAVDYYRDVAPGIVSVGTPGHGGLKLSAERNRAVHPALRNSDGWYEEDCEYHIVGMTFPEVFADPHGDGPQHWKDAGVESTREEMSNAVRSWFPDGWEKATGRAIQPGESYQRDEALFKAAHEGDFVVHSAAPSQSDPSKVLVSARRLSDKQVEEFLVDRDEYKAVPSGKFVIDPTKHAMLPPAPPKPAPGLDGGRALGVDEVSVMAIQDAVTSRRVTAAQGNQIAKDLSQRWRDGENIVTLREMVSAGPVTKTAYADNGRLSYAVIRLGPNGEHFSLKVSKTTFDFLPATDDRSPALRKSQDAQVAEAKAEALRDKVSRSWNANREDVARAREAAERSKALRAEATALYEQQREADIAANGTWEERGAREKALTAARELAATTS